MVLSGLILVACYLWNKHIVDMRANHGEETDSERDELQRSTIKKNILNNRYILLDIYMIALNVVLDWCYIA